MTSTKTSVQRSSQQTSSPNLPPVPELQTFSMTKVFKVHLEILSLPSEDAHEMLDMQLTFIMSRSHAMLGFSFRWQRYGLGSFKPCRRIPSGQWPFQSTRVQARVWVADQFELYHTTMILARVTVSADKRQQNMLYTLTVSYRCLKVWWHACTPLACSLKEPRLWYAFDYMFRRSRYSRHNLSMHSVVL